MPAKNDVGTCRSCGAAIRWVQMAKSGKKSPLDVHPADKGNVAIGEDGLGYTVTGEGRTPPLYLSHFATCPGAASHRKAK